jgi:hypothetical protein
MTPIKRLEEQGTGRNTRDSKWCSGPCERFLPRAYFYLSQACCRGCHRVRSREEFQRNGPSRASKRRKRDRWRYAQDEALRAARCAAERARYWRRKVAA